MSRLKQRLSVGALGLAVSAAAVGCVPAEQYAALKMTSDKNAEQLAHSQSDANAERARADAAERQLQSINNNNASQQAMVTSSQQQAEELRKQNDDMQKKYADAMALMGQMGQSSPLPVALNTELKELADKSPDLITFDARHGVVKFKSDVTFATGDATVTAAGKGVLSRFAQILNSAGTDRYDLLVEGNTDSTPVTNEATRKRGHFDNWYLSAHRAIAVEQELALDGVAQKRMGVVGYADQRPETSNATADGKALNRRVEVMILPSTRTGGSGGGSSYVPVAHATHRTKPATAAPAVDRAVPAAASFGKDAGGPPTPPPAPAPVAPPPMGK